MQHPVRDAWAIAQRLAERIVLALLHAIIASRDNRIKPADQRVVLGLISQRQTDLAEWSVWLGKRLCAQSRRRFALELKDFWAVALKLQE